MADEIDDLKEQIRECVRTTNDNAKAISSLITVSEQQSKDTDRLVKHIDMLLPLNERLLALYDKVEKIENEQDGGIRPKTLKSLMYAACLILLSYGSWSTLRINELEKEILSHESAQEEIKKTNSEKFDKLDKATNENRNQITYLKGRIKDK